MMNKTKYSLSEQTQKLLDAGRIKDCFTLLRRKLTENPFPGGLNILSKSESTYRYLLDFYARGLEDPGREEMLASIRWDLSDVAMRIEKESEASDSPELYFSTLRMCRLRHSDVRDCISKLIEYKAIADLALSTGQYPADIMAHIEEEEERIFNIFWTSDSLTPDIYHTMEEAIKNGTIPFTTSALAIAAAGLSLTKFYNRDAMLMLCTLSSSTDYRISARALASLVVALSRWSKKASDDKKVKEALDCIADLDGMQRKIVSVVKTIIQTRDTDRVSKKMQREVIPGLMQFGPDIIQRLRKSSEEASFDELEGNPEWEELLRNSGLEDKLRELTEMQSDGADVMMVAFSNLKSFPFFRQIRNWMLPFTAQHPMLRALHTIDDNRMSSMLEMSGMMCDSDKYSFAFSLISMPEAQRNMVMTQMQAQSEQVMEQMKDLKALKAGMEFEEELTRYFRDLYRFHKLFPKRAEFYDPFAKSLDFTEIPLLQSVMDSADEIIPIAEFYFKRGYYSDALPLLESVARSSAMTPHVWEKIGFCLEKRTNGNSEAIEAYMKAQLFNPDSRWISRRLGICYRRSADYRNAVEYLKMAMPDDGSFDRKLSLMLADTFAEAGKWDEALNELYRVDYESPDDTEVIRRMARCAFRAGDLEKSERWLKSIPDIDLSEEDHRMLGHIAFLRKDIADAMRRYRLTVRPNDEKRLWKSQILSDIDILENLGGSRADLLLLLESLTYSIE